MPKSFYSISSSSKEAATAFLVEATDFWPQSPKGLKTPFGVEMYEFVSTGFNKEGVDQTTQLLALAKKHNMTVLKLTPEKPVDF